MLPQICGELLTLLFHGCFLSENLPSSPCFASHRRSISNRCFNLTAALLFINGAILVIRNPLPNGIKLNRIELIREELNLIKWLVSSSCTVPVYIKRSVG